MNIQDLDGKFPLRIDPYWKQLKETQRKLIESRLVMVQVRYTDFQLRHMKISAEYLESHMIQLLAKEIAPLLTTIRIDNVAPLDMRDIQPDTIYRKECLVLSTGQLKHIVEYMIKTIPFNELMELRNQDEYENPEQGITTI